MTDTAAGLSALDVAPTGGSAGSTARGAAWSTASYASMGVSQLVLLRVLNGYMSKAEYGVVTAALIVIGFGRIFTMSGVGPAIVQRPDVERRHIETGFLVSMMMGAAGVVTLSLLAPFVGGFFHSDQLVSVIRVISLTFIIQAGGIVGEGLLQRDLQFRKLAIAEVISYVGFTIVGISAAIGGAGIWSLVAANMAQAAIKMVLVLLAARHPMSWHFDRRAGRDLARFASGFTLAKICNYAAINGDNTVIGHTMNKESLAVYGRAYQLLAMPAMLFGQVVDRVLFPVMARLQDDVPKLARTYRRGVAAIATVTGPGGALIMVLAPEIIRTLAGDHWEAAINPLRAFALGLTLRTGYKISDSLARSSGTVFKRAKRQFIYAVLVIVGAYVGHFWGLTASALGVLFALLVNYLMMADLSLKTTGLGWMSFMAAHRRGVLLGAMTGGVGSLIAVPLRHAGVHYLLIILATGIGVAAMFALLIVISRDLVLGDVEWLLQGRRFGGGSGDASREPASPGSPVRGRTAAKSSAAGTPGPRGQVVRQASSSKTPPRSAGTKQQSGRSKSVPAARSAVAPPGSPASRAAAKSARSSGGSAVHQPTPSSPLAPKGSAPQPPTPKISASPAPPRVSAKAVYSATAPPAKRRVVPPPTSAVDNTSSNGATTPESIRDQPHGGTGDVDSTAVSRSVGRPTRSAKSTVARSRVDYEKVDLLALALKIGEAEPVGRRSAKKNSSPNASNPPAADREANRG